MSNINELPNNIYERLEYLEFMLRFRGWVSRTDLKDKFGISDAAATRDIRYYKGLRIGEDSQDLNMSLNNVTKKYEINNSTFEPIFSLTIQQALAKIRKKKFCDALEMGASDGVLTPPRLGLPNIENLANITRAISNGNALDIKYRSVKNGFSNKTVIPHSLFDNGIHWYMRVYDKKRERFIDCALTRVESTSINPTSPSTKEKKSSDHQWNRIVKLELVPHPNRINVKNPKTIEYDFHMEQGCLKLEVRAPVVGYWLSIWNVDCTEDHSLEGYQYQLWLQNHQTLYDVDSRGIAPGLSDYHKEKAASL